MLFCVYVWKDNTHRFSAFWLKSSVKRQHIGDWPFSHCDVERFCCNVASSRIYGHLLFFACPFRKDQADQLSPFSPCVSQVLCCCRLGFSALNMFLLHPGLTMQEFFENGNCLGCVQEDDSPRCRVCTVWWTDSYPEDCLAYGLDIPGKLLCTGKASH